MTPDQSPTTTLMAARMYRPQDLYPHDLLQEEARIAAVGLTTLVVRGTLAGREMWGYQLDCFLTYAGFQSPVLSYCLGS